MRLPQPNYLSNTHYTMISDNLNPKFVRSIQLDYRFEEVQRLKFVCFDIDNQSSALQNQDFIGEMISYSHIYTNTNNNTYSSTYNYNSL